MTLSVVLAFLRRIPAEVWAALFVIGFCVASMFWAYGEGRASRADEVALLSARVSELQSANAHAQGVIERLQQVNRELAEGRAVDQRAAARAVAELRSDRDALQKELDRRRNDRGVIYERDQSAASWGRTVVPGPVADSLRD